MFAVYPWPLFAPGLSPRPPFMPKTEKPEKAQTYESALSELEGIVSRMEDGQLTLEQSLTAYKRGAELVKYCAAQLERVEQQVKLLEGEMLTPFESDASDEEDEAE